MTYTPNHQVATLTQSIDSVQQYVWTFSWAPNGLEKAVKSVNGTPVLTQDFTTDLQGRILSMTYDTVGEVGYDGELYFHYDHLGNTTLLTNTNGNPVYSAQYDPCRGTTLQTWNTNNLEIINKGQGRFGTISMDLPGNNTALLASSGIITISKEAFSAFVAKFKTILFCYLEDYVEGGDSDASPCGKDCLQLEQELQYDFGLRDYWDTQLKNIDEKGCWYEPDNQLKEDRNKKHKVNPFLKEGDCMGAFVFGWEQWIMCLVTTMDLNAKNEMKKDVNEKKKEVQNKIDYYCEDYCEGECWKLANCRNCKEDYSDDCGCVP